MNDDEAKVLRAVAGLRDRDEEATLEAIASETGLPESTARTILDRLFRAFLVSESAVAYWVASGGGSPHVKTYSVTEDGTDALRKQA